MPEAIGLEYLTGDLAMKDLPAKFNSIQTTTDRAIVDNRGIKQWNGTSLPQSGDFIGQILSCPAIMGYPVVMWTATGWRWMTGMPVAYYLRYSNGYSVRKDGAWTISNWVSSTSWSLMDDNQNSVESWLITAGGMVTGTLAVRYLYSSPTYQTALAGYQDTFYPGTGYVTVGTLLPQHRPSVEVQTTLTCSGVQTFFCTVTTGGAVRVSSGTPGSVLSARWYYLDVNWALSTAARGGVS